MKAHKDCGHLALICWRLCVQACYCYCCEKLIINERSAVIALCKTESICGVILRYFMHFFVFVFHASARLDWQVDGVMLSTCRSFIISK